jgi:hypothetical protein
MKTVIELDKEGNRIIYHRSERYAWEHPPEESEECQACTNGTLPDKVKKSNGKT